MISKIDIIHFSLLDLKSIEVTSEFVYRQLFWSFRKKISVK